MRHEFTFRKSDNSVLMAGINAYPVFSVRYESICYEVCVTKAPSPLSCELFHLQTHPQILKSVTHTETMNLSLED
jgi:hypothetical protein